MATVVGLSQISLTQLNLPTPKTPAWCKNQGHISHRSPVIAIFLLKFSYFSCHGNRGWSESNFIYTVKFADLENPLIGARIRNISLIEAKLWQIFCYNFQIFVTMATEVGPKQILITQLNSPTSKTPDWCKNQEHISYRSKVMTDFLLKFSHFRYRGNRGWSETNFDYTVKFADHKNP